MERDGTVLVARESRWLAAVMVNVAVAGAAIATVMAREHAHPLLVAVVGGFALLVLVGAVRMLAAPQEDLRVEETGITVRGRPPIPWAQLLDASVEPDGEGDDQLYLTIADPWWDGLGRWVRRAAPRDEHGRRRLAIPSRSLGNRYPAWLEAIDEGRARYAEPVWPTADDRT